MRAHAHACNTSIWVTHQTVTGFRVIFVKCNPVELQHGVSDQAIPASYPLKGRRGSRAHNATETVAGKRMLSSLESSVEPRIPPLEHT